KYIIRRGYCLPPAASKIKDVQTKYYLAWRLGLVRNVGLIVSANPSTMVSLARFGDEFRDVLIRDIADGTTDDRFAVTDEIRRVESTRLQRNPARAAELETIVNHSGHLYPKDVWPHLGLLGNWTGGSVGAYMRHYGQYFGEPAIRDIG